MTQQRIPQLDALRGIASLAVCLFHFFNYVPIAKYGALGVQAFFVISGFVIPYSMLRSNYGLSCFGRFMARRLVRLDPPYLLSTVLVIALAYLSAARPGFQGKPPNFSLVQVLLHLGYANTFAGLPWLNLVYWTLAIEFQYYLAIGLLFSSLSCKSRIIRISLVCSLLAFSWLPISNEYGGACRELPLNEQFLPYWLPVFLLGIVTFQFRVQLLNKVQYGILFGVASLGILARTHRPSILVVAMSTALVIAFVPATNALLKWLGRISYSLYLVHLPVGSFLANGVAHTALPRWAGSTIAVSGSLLVAECFYRIIERPAQRWASRVTIRPIEPRHLDSPYSLAHTLPVDNQ